MMDAAVSWLLFFFNDTATSEIYTLSLHDALPILCAVDPGAVGVDELARRLRACEPPVVGRAREGWLVLDPRTLSDRSEEHTSELQSRQYLVCRLLLETKTERALLHRLGTSPAVLS